jgi:DNA-binding transcriptional LysR family regulator
MQDFHISYDIDMDHRISLRRLRYFVAVAEELHFGRAAARLRIAQPPLTQQIQKLERELGYQVFLRQPRKTTLTAAGRVLLAGAVRILRDFDDAIEQARRAGRGESGRITLGTPPSVMLAGLPGAIRRYREQRPDVHVAIRELSTAAIADGLATGGLDVGLLREVTAIGALKAELLLREPIVAVLPRAHRLAERPRLSLRHLANEPFVLFPRRLGEDFHDRLIACCVDAGFAPNVVQNATQWQSVVALVETGLGVSLAPASVEKVRLPGVVYRRLGRLTTSITVCAPEEKTSRAVSGFMEVLRRELRG